MTPFQSKPGGPFMVWVPSSAGAKQRRSTGTTDPVIAKAIAALVSRLKRQRRWDLLNAAASGGVTLGILYDADEAGTLAELTARLSDVDLSPLVTEWARHASPKYVKQVRRFIREGEPFPRSQFSTNKISVFLAGLKDARASKSDKLASGSTRNRYHAALSEFARWLVEREIIPTNFLRDVKRSRENAPRMVFYGPQEARRLINKLPRPYQALEALMAVTGLEWSAIIRLRRQDVDLDNRRFFAQGTKTGHRTRVVLATRAKEWDNIWHLFRAHATKVGSRELLFPSLSHERAYSAHRAACKAAKLNRSTLHDWRHTYAVAALKRGELPRYVKQNLGHAPNSTMLETVYGVWIPDERERLSEAQKSPSESPVHD